tara:strand:+ start:141 stop:287 length:147 start_codon:yes stop_codon:yes gene_type:complete
MENKSCEECCCVDSEENPIIIEIDKQGFLIKSLCMLCYAESLDDEKNI